MQTIKLSKTNCFLFEVNQGYLLLDCGYEYDQELFLQRLKEINICIQNIRYVFLTHHHDDHSGLVNFIVKSNPAVSVIMHKDCVNLIATGENDLTHGGGYMNKIVKLFATIYSKLNKKWTLKFPPYLVRKNDHIIYEEDDKILEEIGLRDCRVLFTPGHSIDSISIIIGKNAFVGDAAMNWLKWTGTPYATLFITNTEKYYKSWQKLLDMNIQTLYPAHGKPFSISKLKKYIGQIQQSNLIPL